MFVLPKCVTVVAIYFSVDLLGYVIKIAASSMLILNAELLSVERMSGEWYLNQRIMSEKQGKLDEKTTVSIELKQNVNTKDLT